ncbi:hypothetical protein KX816_01910 [Sphingosinicellaceae bacterium]|nr:hypothetical protein KX816_01910 [Sphingosinicellaceae bacterium]
MRDHGNHDGVRASPLCEPCFEAPPRLSGAERRLSTRAAAAFASGEGSHAFRDNAVTLDRDAAGGGLVRTVGRLVSSAFALPAGPLGEPPETLAAALAMAFARLGETGEVTPFEAAVATPSAACVLLRGVLLPTATGGDAVLSWKQVLDDDATARLRAELLREMRPRAARSAAVDTFA